MVDICGSIQRAARTALAFVVLVVAATAGSAAWGRSEGSGNDDAGCQTAAISPLFDGHRPALLVVLSPRMPYALREWRRMAGVAERAGFRVQAMRDPRVPLREWRQAVAVVGSDRLQGVPAVDESLAGTCGLLNHSPAALAGRCGVVHPWPILGVMPDDALLQVLRARFEALSEVKCP